jgi:hypothetical protein
MPSNDDHSRLQNLGTVMGAPDGGLRYMRRRRGGTADRNGDPLDGIVNLWSVMVVLALGFLVAALTAIGATGLLTDANMTVVTNPGTPEMQVIVKDGDSITRLDMGSGAPVAGVGTLLGSFYKLADGTVVYVPAGQTAPSESAPVPSAAPTPAPVPTVTPPATPLPGVTTPPATPLPGVTTPPATPAPAVTLTPEATPLPTTKAPTTFPTPAPKPAITLAPQTDSP